MAERVKTAADFPIGCRVKFSTLAIQNGLARHRRLPTNFGTVVGHCRTPRLIRVKLDGYKTASRYATVFFTRTARSAGEEGR